MVSVAVSVQWLLSISELFPTRVALHGSSFRMIYFTSLQHSHYRLRKYAFLPCQMVMDIDGFFSEKDRKLLSSFFYTSHAFPLNFFPTCQRRKIFQKFPLIFHQKKQPYFSESLV